MKLDVRVEGEPFPELKWMKVGYYRNLENFEKRAQFENMSGKRAPFKSRRFYRFCTIF